MRLYCVEGLVIVYYRFVGPVHSCAHTLCLAAHYTIQGEGIINSDAVCDEWLGLHHNTKTERHLSQQQLIRVADRCMVFHRCTLA